MSELVNMSSGRANFRWQLMTTVSALAMLGSIALAEPASASDEGDRPTVWIELGGQLERVDGGQTAFAPAFFDAVTVGGFKSPLAVDRPARYSNGAEAKISFVPGSTDWVFSGAIRYGRSNSNKFLHQQPQGQVTRFPVGNKYLTKTAAASYAETKAENSESHLIADFQAGKDVGLGIFGNASTSTVSLGVRFAQFSEKQNATIRARPDVHLVNDAILNYEIPVTFYHRYFGSAERAVTFHGVGPSISWNASAPVGGNTQAGAIAVDWGMNAAVLFGRQKARTHHQSSGLYHYFKPQTFQPSVVQLPTSHGTGDRSRAVVVPNLGGFAGVSFLYSNAKVSFGYRADIFFGALDGGLDTRKSYNREFYGPFATLSVGLGR